MGAGALIAAGLIDWLTTGPPAMLYALPVVLCAALGGYTGGLAAAILSGAGLYGLSTAAHQQSAAIWDVSLLAALASLAAWTTERERRLRRHSEQVAAQLSVLYEKVQANFEGMKRAERLSALGQLSAGLAHEIRNPLASISGAAAILARAHDFDPQSARCLDIITGECERLNGLLTSFLNFARPRPPLLRTVDLAPVLGNVVELAGHGVRGKTIHLEKRLEADLRPVECDPEQLEQVLLNLVINAIEASPDGATVELSASARDGKLSIAVIDQGHGVAPAHIDRLFDPFFTTKEHGTGLGLPVAHQIVRQMNGALLARANPDRGMTFTVVLPAQAAPA